MKENHEKTGLAAFILAVAAILSFGIAVIPALICAVISKRQSEAAGVPTDGFATASMVISGFILGLWALVIFGGGALLLGLGYKMEVPNLSEAMHLGLLIATGSGIALLATALVVRNQTRRREQRRRLRQLAGRH
ncbi:hypothetical protein OKA05_11870 [Luteolibacter arcticus]|uniref:DUF4190 domain-containing protein n=1 Tax=Luteolibacter arcticus TaxID=1581411 RepID=A0ABT3GIC5_9BACT|nr:hypothetical protein [Luteolibacter arcticus]MCW1923252.1 hypothetical protein [Luteolibacter arcticus]